MINWTTISKILGQLLCLEVAFLLGCTALAVAYGEDDAIPFAITSGIAFGLAMLLLWFGRRAPELMTRRESYLIVSLVWVVFSVIGAVPFVLTGAISNPVGAFFENMSGFTTTGASIIDDVERLPHALLFWRSLTQWIGGLGIVFFTVAIIPSIAVGSVRVFSAEATGPMRTKIHPRLSVTGRWIWGIYIFLTLACTACFRLEGMTGFDSFNYAMTVTATGGFATHNDSTGFYKDAVIDYTAVVFMVLSGISFTLLYASIFKGKWREAWRNGELRFFLTAIVLASAVVCVFLIRDCGYDLADGVRYSLFQVVSFITTTGVFNDDAGQWPHITWVVLSACMIFGGCSGSTAGGIKCVRGVMLFQVVRNEIRRLLHPNAVLPVRVNGNSVAVGSLVTLLSFVAMYVTLCFFTYFVMILQGIDSTNAITIAISCASNVGPTLGLEIGPTMSWSILPDNIQLLLSLLMLMGRLEIASVLVLFTRAFWSDR